MMYPLRKLLLPACLILLALPLKAQDLRPLPPEEAASWVGLTLEGAITRFGVPKSVYPIRGLESWQDDVVFEYEGRDLYIYKDRVWQVGLKSAYGISLGDKRAAALLALGEGCQNFENHIIFPLPSRGWPMALRINLNALGAVSAIFVYRSDF